MSGNISEYYLDKENLIDLSQNTKAMYSPELHQPEPEPVTPPTPPVIPDIEEDPEPPIVPELEGEPSDEDNKPDPEPDASEPPIEPEPVKPAPDSQAPSKIDIERINLLADETREMINEAENAMGRALYRANKLRAALAES